METQGKKTEENARLMKKEICLIGGKPQKPKQDTEYIEVDNNYYALCYVLEQLTNELRKMRHGR